MALTRITFFLCQCLQVKQHYPGVVNTTNVCYLRVIQKREVLHAYVHVNRNSKVLNHKCRRLLANSLVLCHLDYCSTSWYPGLSKKLKQKLQVIQNKVVRFISNKGPRSHVGAHELSSIGFLKVDSRVEQLCLNHMFGIYHKICPHYMLNKCVKVNTQHSYSTRSSHYNFVVPKVHGNLTKTFYFNGIKRWNSLPNDIKSITQRAGFKQKVKRYLSHVDV